MEKGKKQSGLTDSDKEWIVNLMVTTVKPINDHSTNIENCLKAIENCPRIQKELK